MSHLIDPTNDLWKEVVLVPSGDICSGFVLTILVRLYLRQRFKAVVLLETKALHIQRVLKRWESFHPQLNFRLSYQSYHPMKISAANLQMDWPAKEVFVLEIIIMLGSIFNVESIRAKRTSPVISAKWFVDHPGAGRQRFVYFLPIDSGKLQKAIESWHKLTFCSIGAPSNRTFWLKDWSFLLTLLLIEARVGILLIDIRWSYDALLQDGNLYYNNSS